jgi:hypothetical protein
MIDLILVEYHDHDKEVLTAPYLKLKPGDIVQTDWGFGEVKQVVNTFKEDDVLGIFDAAHPLHAVKAVLVNV